MMDPTASFTYQAIVDHDEDNAHFVTAEMLDEANILEISRSVLHVLSGNRSSVIEVVNADFAAKSFVLRIDGTEHHIRLRDAVEARVHAMGFDINKNHAQQKEITSPMPGLVLKVLVQPGDQVIPGQPVLVLEAMKMENVLGAPTEGTVGEILIEEGRNVDKGQLLVRFD